MSLGAASRLKEINYEARDFSNCPVSGLSLVLIAAAISAGQSAGTMLGEAEAQALIKKFQGQPGAALTRIESQRLLKYFIAKNANSSPSTVVVPQTESGETAAHPIAPSTTQLAVQAVAEPRNRSSFASELRYQKPILAQALKNRARANHYAYWNPSI